MMSKRIKLIAVAALPFIAAVLGYGAGPFLARSHRTVQLAEAVLQEEAGRVEIRTFELDAYHHSGAQRAALLAEAERVTERFRFGGAALGAWIGLVLAVKSWSLRRPSRRTEYEAEKGYCLSCGRCFLYCPRERVRLKNRVGEGGGDTS
jgi:ferredoxin